MSLAGHRRQQAWEATGQRSAPRLLKHAPVDQDEFELAAAAPEGEEVVGDYTAFKRPTEFVAYQLEHPVALKSESCGPLQCPPPPA